MARVGHVYRTATLAWLVCTMSVTALAQTSLIEADSELLQAVPTLRMHGTDLNQDSLTDIVALQFDSGDPERNRIIVQRQLPTSPGEPVRFQTIQVVPATFPQDITLVDIDADGDQDLLVAQDLGTDALAIWLNAGGPQQGNPGLFQRHPARYSANLAGAVRTLRIEAGEPRDDVLLVGGVGRPSRLYENLPFAGSPLLLSAQSIPHPGAIGAETGDLNGDGRDDIVLYGTQTHVYLSNGMSSNPMVLLTSDPFAGVGTVFAASLRDLDGDNNPELVLATGSQDLIYRHAGVDANSEPIFVLNQTLSLGPPGTSRGFAWIDADGDGLEDLVAARDNINAPASVRGSPIYGRDGVSFSPAPTQLVSPSAALLASPLSIGTSTHLWLGSSRTVYNSLWRSATAGALPPVASFGGNPAPSGVFGYFYGTRIGIDLRIVPAAIEATTLLVNLSGDMGPVNSLGVGLGAGQRRSGLIAQVPADERITQRWDLLLSQVIPMTAASIGTPSQAAVVTVYNPFDSGFKLNCYLACVFVGLCEQPTVAPAADQSPVLRAKGGENLMGTSAEVTLLQRLRDERMASSIGGAYYIDLYLSLQLDLYAATFADPLFYNDLWELKDAWMPAIADLVDADGSMSVTVEMQDRLLAALLRFEALGSESLRAAIHRERQALDLAGLAGQPIAVLQQRWESEPIFADSFD